jgi:hypothetical protein
MVLLWMACNHYLHEKDEQGLLLKEGQFHWDGITEQFSHGLQALLPVNRHLLEACPLPVLLSLQPEDKYTWLGAITIAHEAADHECSTTEGHMCADLRNYLQTGQCQPTTPSTNTTAGSLSTNNNYNTAQDNNDNNSNNNNNNNNDDDDIHDNDDNNEEDDEASFVADN